jgi:hypothetical protein
LQPRYFFSFASCFLLSSNACFFRRQTMSLGVVLGGRFLAGF